MDFKDRIFVAGHRGLVGSAIHRHLVAKGYENLLVRTHDELDLHDQAAVREFFDRTRPDYVFLAAAKVGGIWANNTLRAEFIYNNLQIQNNIIHSAYLFEVKKLLFLGSSCIYPRDCPQPMKETHLLTGPLEYTNEPYAVAKIAGIKMCESYNLQYGTNFISAMPTNIYGPGDNFNLETSHVLPALIRKFHLAQLAMQGDWEGIRRDELVFGPIPLEIRESLGLPGKAGGSAPKPGGRAKVTIWGTGKPRREFLHTGDLAEACVFLMEHYDFRERYSRGTKDEIRNTHVNVGVGEDASIRELVEIVRDAVGFDGEVHYREEMPDGTMRKLLDVSLIRSMGWRHKIELREGIASVYDWYRKASFGPPTVRRK